MDRFTSIGINIVIEALRDKLQRPKVRKAALKLLREILIAYEMDQDFIDVVKSFVADKEEE
jgi:hypothetical protein